MHEAGNILLIHLPRGGKEDFNEPGSRSSRKTGTPGVATACRVGHTHTQTLLIAVWCVSCGLLPFSYGKEHAGPYTIPYAGMLILCARVCVCLGDEIA